MSATRPSRPSPSTLVELAPPRPQASLVEAWRCPVCGGESFSTAFEEPPYRVLRCRVCGTGVVTPRLDEAELRAMYINDAYWRSASPKTHGYHDYRSDQPLYLKTFRRRLDYALQDGPSSGHALDVGCAAGFCMAALRERGFEVHGLEVSETIASHARDELGFDTIHIGTLETAPYRERSFDLITMWDVVEHVVDPRALLERARALLKPDGLLVLETQNIDSRFARLLGPRWHHFKHAEHIYHFTPSSIRTLLESAGFAVKRLTPRFAGKYVSTHFIVERAQRLHPAVSALLKPLTAFDSASVYLNFMDEVIVTARPAEPAA
jgi:2-polyprenyl-3-methyl-5-hydroxy-6-metoxy-1,4-benzoquinol methylase